MDRPYVVPADHIYHHTSHTLAKLVQSTQSFKLAVEIRRQSTGAECILNVYCNYII